MQPVVAAPPRLRTFVAAGMATAALVVAVRVSDEPATPGRAGLIVGRIPSAAPWAPPPWSPAPIALVAIPAKTVVAPGQQLELSVLLANRSERSILAIPSLDASDDEWRFPKIAVEARDGTGRLVSTEDPEKHGRCGNINDLRYTDFVLVRPGEALDITGENTFGLDAWAPLAPGRYSIRVRYDLSFVGSDGAMYDELSTTLVEALPHNIYFSNPITIDVRAPAPP